jgi:4-diphosphocytidyl-2-C-methyl-D-erythritol kinase
MCTTGLFDTIDMSAAPSADLATIHLSLAGECHGLKADETNLVVRAARALASSVGRPELSASIELTKRIPIGGGLGGGSSDAATTLIGLNEFWQSGRSRKELSDLAATLGSDVAFFLYGPSCVATGRGQVLRPIDRPRPKWALLILPAIHMPTPAVYRKFDELGLGRDADVATEPDWQQWTTLAAQLLLPVLVNDLEVPAFALSPELGRIRSELELKLSRPVRMSGSGSTLFTLFDGRDEADQAAGTVRMTGIHAVVVPLAPKAGGG